jgi:hypothetical protein
MTTYTTGNLMIGHYLAGEVSLEGVQAASVKIVVA